MDELRDFRCGSCEAEFATWEELDGHRRSAHGAPPADGLHCPTCGELFASPAELEEHDRDKHLVPVPDDEEV